MVTHNNPVRVLISFLSRVTLSGNRPALASNAESSRSAAVTGLMIPTA